MEVWKPIEGCDGYEVSNFGRARSLKRKTPRVIKQRFLHSTGSLYLSVMFNISGKNKIFNVHRLVAQAFIPNPENKPCVNHINGVKTDNRVENLEWVTSSENKRHAVATGLSKSGENHHRAKLTKEQVVFIRNNPQGLTSKALAKKFNITPETINRIQLGLFYKNVGGNIRNKRVVPNDIRIQIRAEYKPWIRECSSRALAKKYGLAKSTVLKIVHEI